MISPPLFADLDLARRLERTEARNNAAFVEARAWLFPDRGAGWQEVAGAYALFDGPDSPLTQTFGLGIFAETTAADLAEIEAFFAARHAPVLHEISPLAHDSLWPLLRERGYFPVEFTNVLYRSLESLPELTWAGSPLTIRTINAAEADVWARVAATGWLTDAPEFTEFLQDLGQTSAQSEGMTPFLAELDGLPIATASLYQHAGIALLAGASTVPAGRRQGAQTALLAARLHLAASQGCTLAMMGARPGSQSQRNAERHGFRMAYTRVKWQLMR